MRIANQLAILGVTLSASTVRNILNQPKPKKSTSAVMLSNENKTDSENRQIPAFYPNHVWSIDCTTILRWGLWPTYIFIVIDHYSRKLITVQPLEGPNTGWIINALEQAFREVGPPKHIISDQHGTFISGAYKEFIESWKIKPRYGAVGKHGSIAVTERSIKTLKYEWLKRVPLIKGFEHLKDLCGKFKDWYNNWRPHMNLDGARPEDFYCRDLPEMPGKEAKVVPLNIERRYFKETRVTGFRLAA